MTPAGALKVINFLNSRSKDLAGWNTDPLWQAVDGPYKLKSYPPTTGVQTFVRNKQVHRSQSRPHRQLHAAALYQRAGRGVRAARRELGDLRLPAADRPAGRGRLKSAGYSVAPWPLFGFAQLPLNLTNPKVGPIFQQLYIRQAMQHLIDQSTWSKRPSTGTRCPTYGPVPTAVPNPFVDTFEKHNPYPYSPSAATPAADQPRLDRSGRRRRHLRQAGHGRGPMREGHQPGSASCRSTCSTPAATPLWPRRSPPLQTDFALAGIQLNLSPRPDRHAVLHRGGVQPEDRR